MNNNAIAVALARFGRREARALAALKQVQEERCAFLCGLAPGAGLSPDVEAQSVAPKDRE